MKNSNLIIMFVVSISILAYVYYFNKSGVERPDLSLHNNLLIRGRVLNIKTSNNHSFGILVLDLDSANVKEFNNPINTGFFPYKVKGGRAEVYTFIPDGIETGDIVIVNSNEQVAVYYYIKTKQRFEGSIKIITDNYDIDYIKNNTVLN